eukprot:TRINITY_DN12119_c0_g2_i1.p5 TRINITY_DN12119_c0_g2~~TRINITY_DN12119_c0_g2_i1.p5  ORF type:complete len:108 (+),score=1.54 TRINITY_DN12119_c0_g2_i1:1225-1548(+)
MVNRFASDPCSCKLVECKSTDLTRTDSPRSRACKLVRLCGRMFSAQTSFTLRCESASKLCIYCYIGGRILTSRSDPHFGVNWMFGSASRLEIRSRSAFKVNHNGVEH